MKKLNKNQKIILSIIGLVLLAILVRAYYIRHHVPKFFRDSALQNLSYKPGQKMTKEEFEAQTKANLSYKAPVKMTKEEFEAQTKANLSYKPPVK